MLIGIAGKAGSGKDTIADYLIMNHGMYRYSFAKPIKDALNAIFGFEDRMWLDREWKEKEIDWLGKSPRYLAQTLGTEWGRDLVHKDLWLMLAKREYEKTMRLVIPDVRFGNEADWVRSEAGIVIHVERPGIEEVNSHSSEAGVEFKMGDLLIVNDGDKQSLYHKVEEALFSGG